MIVHGMDGYDEISLTHDTKIITKEGEKVYSTSDLDFEPVTAESIQAGSSIQETAEIFKTFYKERNVTAKCSGFG